jgi:hypothetical protein
LLACADGSSISCTRRESGKGSSFGTSSSVALE